MNIKNIIFDFGGVVMDWDPRYFFRDYFNDDEKMEYFLGNIATNEWNAEQDRGRSVAEANALLIAKHPEWEKEILAYYENWHIMLRSDIPENVSVLQRLKGKYELFGLTNWSAEFFPYALANYEFFNVFEGKIVVSGEEKLIKPNPKIWEVLLDRYQIKAEEFVFIDDNFHNIETAKSLDFITVHVNENMNLETELKNLGLDF